MNPLQEDSTLRTYKAATQDDLWESLTEQAHKENKLPRDVTVKMIMDTWTLQMGFPVINVERDYASNTATITQVGITNYSIKDDSD